MQLFGCERAQLAGCYSFSCSRWCGSGGGGSGGGSERARLNELLTFMSQICWLKFAQLTTNETRTRSVVLHRKVVFRMLLLRRRAILIDASERARARALAWSPFKRFQSSIEPPPHHRFPHVAHCSSRASARLLFVARLCACEWRGERVWHFVKAKQQNERSKKNWRRQERRKRDEENLRA